MADEKEAVEKTAAATKKAAAKAKGAAEMNSYAFAEAGQAALRETMERSTAAFGEMSDYGKENLDAMIASFTAATEGAEKINSNAVAFTKKTMEDGVSAAKSMASVRSIQEAVEMQTEFAKSALEGYLAEMTKTADLMASVMKDTWKPFNERTAAAMDQFQAGR